MELQALFCVSDVLSFEILRYKSLSLSLDFKMKYIYLSARPVRRLIQ